MLEKAKGNIRVNKLQAILLLEAGLNTIHKIIFNGRVLPKLEIQQSIPLEIIGRCRRQSTHHIVLSKKLISNIGN